MYVCMYVCMYVLYVCIVSMYAIHECELSSRYEKRISNIKPHTSGKTTNKAPQMHISCIFSHKLQTLCFPLQIQGILAFVGYFIFCFYFVKISSCWNLPKPKILTISCFPSPQNRYPRVICLLILKNLHGGSLGLTRSIALLSVTLSLFTRYSHHILLSFCRSLAP